MTGSLSWRDDHQSWGINHRADPLYTLIWTEPYSKHSSKYVTFSWIRATIYPCASTNWVSYLAIHLLEFVLCFTSVKITVPFAASTTLQFFDPLRVGKSLYWHVLGTQYCAPMTGPPILSEGLAILLSYNQGLVWSLRGRLCALLECTLCRQRDKIENSQKHSKWGRNISTLLHITTKKFGMIPRGQRVETSKNLKLLN